MSMSIANKPDNGNIQLRVKQNNFMQRWHSDIKMLMCLVYVGIIPIDYDWIRRSWIYRDAAGPGISGSR